MATDYDAPRTTDILGGGGTALDELDIKPIAAADTDEGEILETLDLPGADLSALSAEELSVQVLPKQSDEFTCMSCFLVQHHSRRATGDGEQAYCRDCV
ncbi:DUF4193 domain-containing protein [Rhodococcus rhodochrous]|uniref:DUF4193 domain-containing protein n=1 Tax=Rhodococcus rhodochrous TaxID=1829 RepID=A0AAW4XHD6_RHORH|nr:DUF4193 domain-containing protein [Rhodococcus rhodochrous]MCD2112383.1 DUF4193 domain-containing protein [Rhodococcus rhodochrous]